MVAAFCLSHKLAHETLILIRSDVYKYKAPDMCILKCEKERCEGKAVCVCKRIRRNERKREERRRNFGCDYCLPIFERGPHPSCNGGTLSAHYLIYILKSRLSKIIYYHWYYNLNKHNVTTKSFFFYRPFHSHPLTFYDFGKWHVIFDQTYYLWSNI